MGIELSLAPDPDEVEVVRKGLSDYAESIYEGLPDFKQDLEFSFISRDENGEINAGLTGSGFWNAMHIAVIWVAEHCRGQNLGSELLDRAELLARKHDFGLIYLDTSRAKDFYEKHGYKVFGVLENQPPGHNLFFMQKRLGDE
ncbi:MAG: GNAT family N-acetyltransferase [Pseudomonadota bacterium]